MRSVARVTGAVLIAIGAVLFAFGGRHVTAQTAAQITAQTADQITAQTAAQPPAPFQMSARADTVGEEIVATGFPAVPNGEIAFATLSTAQATLDITTSQAFASAPNPGDFVANLPPTINGLGSTAGLPPFPSYPFYVTSSNPTTPSTGQQAGPYSIAASSADNSSRADALIGLSTSTPQIASGASHASVIRDPATGIMVAQATSDIAPFAVNKLLSIGEVRGSATLTYDPANPGAGVKKQTSFSVGTLTIAGVEVGFTDKGLSAGGKSLLPVDVSALQRALAPTGVSVQYVPGTQTATSVTSAGLQISYRNANLPAPFLDTTLRYVLGQVSATVNPGAGLPGSGGEVTPGEPGAVPTEGSATAASPALAGSPAASGLTAPASSAPTLATAPSARQRVVQRRIAAGPLQDFSNFYLVFIVAGVLALGSSQLLQWMKFRLALNARAGIRSSP